MANQGVLIFDGDCGFCTTVSNYIIKDTRQPVVAEAWQLTDVTKYGLTYEQTAARVYLVMDGKTYAANHAVAKLLENKKNWFLFLVGKIIGVPPISYLAKPGYYLVAKYRHKLPGGTPACKL